MYKICLLAAIWNIHFNLSEYSILKISNNSIGFRQFHLQISHQRREMNFTPDSIR